MFPHCLSSIVYTDRNSNSVIKYRLPNVVGEVCGTIFGTMLTYLAGRTSSVGSWECRVQVSFKVGIRLAPYSVHGLLRADSTTRLLLSLTQVAYLTRRVRNSRYPYAYRVYNHRLHLRYRE
jgi:hypothetical protein